MLSRSYNGRNDDVSKANFKVPDMTSNMYGLFNNQDTVTSTPEAYQE